MALLTPQQVAVTGTQVTYAAATVTTGDTCAPDDHTCFEIVNGSGGTITATLDVPGTTFGQANADVPVSILNGVTKRIGPLVAALADPTTGLCKVTCSSVTTVTIAAVRV